MHGLGLGLRFNSLGGGEGGQANNLPASFYAPQSSSLTLVKGIGPYSFTGSSVAPSATITDFEGIVHNCKANEARFPGSRRVENIGLDINDPAIVDTLDANSTDVSTSTESIRRVTVTHSAGVALIYKGSHILNADYDGETILGSVAVKIISGISNISGLAVYQGSSANTKEVTSGLVEGEWVRVAADTITNIADGHIGIATSHTGDFVFELKNIQYEKVTGQTLGEQGIPGEYVSVGVSDQLNGGMTEDDATGTASISDAPYEQAILNTTNSGWYWGNSKWVISGGFLTSQSAASSIHSKQRFINGHKYSYSYTISSVAMLSVNICGNITAATIGSHSGEVTAISGGGGNTDDLLLLGTSWPVGSGTEISDVVIIDLSVHGSNVDGIKYFDYHNTLEVVDNVVIGTGGRGSELSADLGFDNASVWTTTLCDVNSTNASALTFTGGPGVGMSCYSTATNLVDEDRYYEVILDFGGGTLGNVVPVIGGAEGDPILADVSEGLKRQIIKAGATGSIGLKETSFAATDVVVRSFSVKKIDVPNSYAPGSTFGRRVENLSTAKSDGWTNEFNEVNSPTVTYGRSDPLGGNNAVRVVGSTNLSRAMIFSAHASVVGNTYTFSIWIKINALGTNASVELYVGFDSPSSSTGRWPGIQSIVSADSTWHRVSLTDTCDTLGSPSFGVIADESGTDVEIFGWQLEDVTGQTNQNPGEYVSKGVDVYPFSGTGLDGVAEFATTNPNEVNSNVVAATATTYPVTPPKKLLIEEARTNTTQCYADASVTTGITVSGAGILSVVADASSPYSAANVFLLDNSAEAAASYAIIACATIAATSDVALYCQARTDVGGAITDTNLATPITFTNDSWDYVGGVLNSGNGVQQMVVRADAGAKVWFIMPQRELGPFPTSYIPTEGSAVLRDADKLEYPASNYSDEMTIVGEFTLDGDLAGITRNIIYIGDGTNITSIAINTDGKFTVSRIASGLAILQSASVLLSGRHRFAVVFSMSAGMTIGYLDGISIPFSFNQSGSNYTPDNFSIGKPYNDIYYLNGNIGDIKIYNKLLSAEKAQELSKVESD